MRPNATPPSKGRLQQALRKHIATEVAKAPKLRNSAKHNWLVRHMERQGGRCAYCGIPMSLRPGRGKADRRATLDHVVPLSRRGADSEANTVAACAACNTAKADKTAQMFRTSPFVIARKAYAATVADPVRLTVTVLRPRRR